MNIDSNCLFNNYNSNNIDENYYTNKKNFKENESETELNIQNLSKEIKKLKINKALKAKNNKLL